MTLALVGVAVPVVDELRYEEEVEPTGAGYLATDDCSRDGIAHFPMAVAAKDALVDFLVDEDERYARIVVRDLHLFSDGYDCLLDYFNLEFENALDEALADSFAIHDDVLGTDLLAVQ